LRAAAGKGDPPIDESSGSVATKVAEPQPDHEFAVEARSQWKMVLQRFLRHKLAVISLFIFVSLVLISVILPHFWKYSYKFGLRRPDPYPFKGANDWLRPSWTHPFGLDRQGKDMVAQVLRGLQYSLRIAMIVAVLATLIGVVIGAVSGYFRGWVDSTLMRFVDLVLVIPFQVAVATLAFQVKGSSWFWIAIFLALFSWMGTARIIRGEFLSLREKEFVEAARAIGAPDRRIIFRHILPNTLGPIIVNVTLAVGGAVLAEAALSFIGLGVHLPDTSLGFLINDHEGEFAGLPWLFWWPFAILVLISLTINFIGDGLRDAFDPRQNRVRA
jgi:peptide/nickel transport system permease protein